MGHPPVDRCTCSAVARARGYCGPASKAKGLGTEKGTEKPKASLPGHSDPGIAVTDDRSPCYKRYLNSSTVSYGVADHGRNRLRVNFVGWPGITSTWR